MQLITYSLTMGGKPFRPASVVFESSPLGYARVRQPEATVLPRGGAVVLNDPIDDRSIGDHRAICYIDNVHVV